MCYYIKIYIFQNWILFYPAFPTRKLRYDVCAAVRPPLQGTEGCARSTAVCFIPLHAGASTRRNNRYSAIWASCQVVARHIPPFVRIFPFRADGVMGKQWHILRVPSVIPPAVTGRKSPLFVCPADRFFYPPKPSFIPFINIPLYIPGDSASYICIGITFSRHSLPAAA